MNRVEWNDGMSIGVKVLDDDHKRLIDAINKLYNAIDANETEDILEDIFSTLEDYVHQHFHREEEFMRQCNYENLDAHIKQHQLFATRVPELKAELLNATTYIAAQEISIYLTDWLLNHIMSEDISLIVHFDKCKLVTDNNSNNNGWYKNIIYGVVNRLSFSKRILLVMVIPLFAMMSIGSIIIWNDYLKYQDMTKLSHVSHVVSDINHLIHAMQIERGLTSGYLVAKNEKFRVDLQKQRSVVDQEINKFLFEIEHVHVEQLSEISLFVERLKKDVQTLLEYRKMVDNKTISKLDSIDFYVAMIDNILTITSKMPYFNLDSELSSSIYSLSSILRFKELKGQERAYGIILIEQKRVNKEEYEKFLYLLGMQSVLLKQFENTATKDQKKAVNKSSEVLKEVKFYEQKLKNSDFDNFDSVTWFNLMTEYINSLKIVGDQLSQEVDSLVTKRIDDSIFDLVLWFIFMNIVMIITILITYIFKESSLEQIHNFTNAMRHLAKGDRSLRIKPLLIDDEISEMIDAYEISRQKLLKADIFAKLYLNKKDIEIKHKERENVQLEKIAFIDPLTGVLNRRKFEELATLEIARSSRYKHELSFLMLDIDHFKAINDNYGHSFGDEVLKHFSKICTDTARSLDIVARIGGEEFVIMLAESDNKSSYAFADRLRRTVFESGVALNGLKIHYSVSIGIAIFDFATDKDLKSMLERADKALYRAKESGRNRVSL